MKLKTRHFGEIEVNENKKITFKEGLPGFEGLRDFILFEDAENPFCYLQSIEEGSIAFAIIDPYIVMKEYKPYINESYFEKLGGGKDEEFSMYVIATVGENIENTTLNLQAPLLIHVGKRLGVQAIVEDNLYKTKHNLLELVKERG